MLSIKDLVVGFHHHEVIRGVTLHLSDGEVVAILGSNGAGKTTLLTAICGLVKVTGGSIVFNGLEISKGLPTYKIARMGISLVHEARWIFSDQTVLGNLMLGAYYHQKKKEILKRLDYVYDLFPILKERKNQLAGFLSGGEQQMLSIAKSLMSKPRIIMLDEPSLGLAPLVIKSIFQSIRSLKDEGMMILIVEQSVAVTLEISDRAYVLELGKITLEGSASEIKSDPKVIEAYLAV
ncbi:MAG: ABC transporter ATP-binding protein [Thermodesulfobacteriota bacterium]